MDLSIICPCFNESSFIDEVIENLCAEDGLTKEVLIVDGGSTDGTREKILIKLQNTASLRLVDNPMRTSTHAFNLAFKQSIGNHVAFVGAHATYDKNYFGVGVAYLKSNECDVVGGPLRQLGKGDKGRAIACAMSSKFGVGNTEFRTETKKMYVDSVAFAIYKREVVESCGLMDETLPVNQDDEFHYRIKSKGFRIMMVPEMKADYYVRETYTKLFRQYFRYGLYKPAVLMKVGGSVRPRHVIPSLFTLYLISVLFFYFIPVWIGPFALYVAIITTRSLTFKESWKVRMLAIPSFPILHFAYGSGFIIGLLTSKGRITVENS